MLAEVSRHAIGLNRTGQSRRRANYSLVDARAGLGNSGNERIRHFGTTFAAFLLCRVAIENGNLVVNPRLQHRHLILFVFVEGIYLSERTTPSVRYALRHALTPCVQAGDGINRG